MVEASPPLRATSRTMHQPRTPGRRGPIQQAAATPPRPVPWNRERFASDTGPCGQRVDPGVDPQLPRRGYALAHRPRWSDRSPPPAHVQAWDASCDLLNGKRHGHAMGNHRTASVGRMDQKLRLIKIVSLERTTGFEPATLTLAKGADSGPPRRRQSVDQASLRRLVRPVRRGRSSPATYV